MRMNSRVEIAGEVGQVEAEVMKSFAGSLRAVRHSLQNGVSVHSLSDCMGGVIFGSTLDGCITCCDP